MEENIFCEQCEQKKLLEYALQTWEKNEREQDLLTKMLICLSYSIPHVRRYFTPAIASLFVAYLETRKLTEDEIDKVLGDLISALELQKATWRAKMPEAIKKDFT